MKTDNEIMAQFMGLTYKKDHTTRKYWHYEKLNLTSKNLSFDTSWDWLMPVVEKINKLNDSDQLKGLDYDLYRSMQDWIISVDIESAYADAVSIIKWYNTQASTAYSSDKISTSDSLDRVE